MSQEEVQEQVLEEESPTLNAPKSKELETLSKVSLVHLARYMGKLPEGLTFPMLLNIPTITIVNIIYQLTDKGLLNDEEFTQQAAVVERCMILWRKQTAELKNKERIKIIEKALREMGKTDIADNFVERCQNKLAVTLDMFVAS